MNDLMRVEKETSKILAKLQNIDSENKEIDNLVKELVLCESESQLKDIKDRYKEIICTL